MDMIYTYGGGHTLYKIFNGIAAFCTTDSPYYTAFLTPVLLIGTVWVGAVATAKADIGLFAKKWYVPTFILLSILLIPKTSIWIKDEVDPTFGSDKVDNIPVGLAFVAGATSTLSHVFTELIESSFTTGDITKFSKTGYAFSSRLAQEARTVRITDPRILANVKDWSMQCVWLPYIKTNIKGKGQSARTTDDLLTWVETKGHPSLGIYWRNETGKREYKTCKATAPLIREALKVEETKTLGTLAARLFGFSKGEMTGVSLKPYMESSWNFIGNSTKGAAEHIQQMLVVNALKEGFDDKREKYGYRRIHPELISIGAARALHAQGMAGWVKGVSASLSLPLIQAVLLGVLSIVFFLVIPFAFMPGGFSIFALWVRMVFAVQLWPVFSSILNAVSILWLDRAADTVLMGEKGFSIATTTGLADAAWSVASWSAGIQLLVPVISWAFVSKSGYALTSVFQSATGSIDATASRLGSDAVEGNVSLNNLSMMNRTLASESVAQQSLGMSQNFASTLNTGDRTVSNTLGGEAYVQQQMSTLQTNVSSQEFLAASLGESHRESQARAESQAKSFNKTIQDTSSDMLSFTDRLSKGVDWTEGVSQTDQIAIQKTADETKTLLESFRNTHDINSQTATSAALGTKVLGVGPEVKVSAYDQEAVNKIMSSDEGKRLSENFSKLGQFAQDHRGHFRDSSGQDRAESLSHNLSKLQSQGESLSHSYTKTKNLENLKNFTEGHSFSASSNENDAWLHYVGGQTGLSKADSVDYLGSHPNEANVMMAGYMAQKKENLLQHVDGMDHVMSQEEIKGFLEKNNHVINSEGRDRVQSRIDQTGFKSEALLEDMNRDGDERYSQNVAENEARFESENQEIASQNQSLQVEYNTEKAKTNIRRGFEKMNKDTMSTMQDSLKGLNDKLEK